MLRRLPAAVAGALPILFIPISVDSFILPRVSLLLVSTALGCAGAIWVGPGRGLGALRWPAVMVCMAALVAGLLSVAPLTSLAGSYTRYESWPVRIAYVGAFCVSVWLLRSPRDVERVGSWFCVGVAGASTEAALQGLLGLLARPDGNLGQPGLLGVLCAMALPLALWRARTQWRWIPLAALVGVGLALSSARSAWAAAAVGVFVMLMLVSPRRRRWVAAGGLGVLLGLVGLLLLSPLRFLNGDTGSARLHVWKDALGLVAARPLTGWGEDTTGTVLPRFLTGDWEPGNYFDRVHSQPLDLLATQGLLGLASCALFFGVLWRARLRRSASVSASAESCVLLGSCAAYTAWSLANFDWAPATGPFWILAGAAWWGLGSVDTLARVPRWRPVATGLGLLGMLAGVAPVLADVAYHGGDVATAHRLNPIQAQYWGG